MVQVFEHAVYVGAGNRMSAAEFKSKIAAKQYVFIISDEQSIERWIAACEGNSDHLLHRFITKSGGSHAFYRYNLSEFNGAKKATALNELFPSLKLKGQSDESSVTLTEALTELKEQHGLHGNDKNLLFIDLPGGSGELIQSLGSDVLKLFDRVQLTATQEALFEGDETSQALEQEFSDSNYNVEIALLDTD